VFNTGGGQVPVVIADYSAKDKITAASLFPAGYQYSVPLDKWHLTDQACDYIYAGDHIVDFEIPGTLGLIYNCNIWKDLDNKTRSYPLFCGEEYLNAGYRSGSMNFVALDASVVFGNNRFLSKIKDDHSVVFILDTMNQHGMAEQRRVFIELMNQGLMQPVIIKRNYRDIPETRLQLYASTDAGALLLDGMGDGIWIKAPGVASEKSINSLSFGILQATRTRISKTEYISCPSCGRTLFDLQETTAKIRSRTDHLKGLKIGIMGCIVNGPGEMADADYGYVGVGVGKITLYKGREVVKKNIDSAVAVDELIELIRSHGDWIEK